MLCVHWIWRSAREEEGRQITLDGNERSHYLLHVANLLEPFLPAAHFLVKEYGPNEEGTVESTASLQKI